MQSTYTNITYRIDRNTEAAGGNTITCLVCGLKSFHPDDVAHRYCGKCQEFHIVMALQAAAVAPHPTSPYAAVARI